MNKLFHKLKSAVKAHKRVSLAVLSTLLIAVPIAAHAGFYPGRPTFDYNNYNGNNNCADTSNPARNNGRCGSLNGPVFDSFVNTPTYGDERSFFDGFRTDLANGNAADPVTNVTDGSQEVTLRIYVHNNANSGTNCQPVHQDPTTGDCTQVDNDSPGVAHNTRVSIALPAPTLSANDLRAVGAISADNANPGTVYDTADLTANKNFTVAYIPGSAIEYNNGPFKNGQQLPDSIVTPGGTQIGYNALDGIFPGCFNYIAVVEIKVKITPTTPPNNSLTITKKDRLAGSTAWGHQVNAKPGDTVQWQLNTTDNGTSTLSNVTTNDLLPSNLQIVPNSVQFTNARGTEQLADGPLFGGGYNAGSYNPNDNTVVTFETKVLDNFDGCTVIDRNIANAVSDQTPKATDDADVVITKPNCTPPPNPTYTCDALSLSAGDNRTVTINNFATTAKNGASFSNAVIDWGDSSTPLTSASPVGQTHQYAADGTYTVTATAHFTIAGQTGDVTATSPNCTQQVTVKAPTPVYTCDALSLSTGDNRTVTIGNLATTATNGASFKNAVIDWGDNSTPLTTSNPGGQTHQYAQDGTFTVTATAHFTVNGQTGDVTATSPNCTKSVTFSTTPQNPTFTCDLLQINSGANRLTTYKVNTTTTGGAQVSFYRYDFGDGTPVFMTDKDTVQHTYAKDGQFASHVQVGFTVNGQTQTVDSPACSAAVTYNTPPPPPPPTTVTTTSSPTPTSPAPTQLVNTGPGSIVAIFAATTIGGTFAYRWYLGRRLSRQ